MVVRAPLPAEALLGGVLERREQGRGAAVAPRARDLGEALRAEVRSPRPGLASTTPSERSTTHVARPEGDAPFAPGRGLRRPRGSSGGLEARLAAVRPREDEGPRVAGVDPAQLPARPCRRGRGTGWRSGWAGTVWHRFSLTRATTLAEGRRSRHRARTAARSEAMRRAAASPLPATSPRARRSPPPLEDEVVVVGARPRCTAGSTRRAPSPAARASPRGGGSPGCGRRPAGPPRAGACRRSPRAAAALEAAGREVGDRGDEAAGAPRRKARGSAGASSATQPARRSSPAAWPLNQRGAHSTDRTLPSSAATRGARKAALRAQDALGDARRRWRWAACPDAAGGGRAAVGRLALEEGDDAPARGDGLEQVGEEGVEQRLGGGGGDHERARGAGQDAEDAALAGEGADLDVRARGEVGHVAHARVPLARQRGVGGRLRVAEDERPLGHRDRVPVLQEGLGLRDAYAVEPRAVQALRGRGAAQPLGAAERSRRGGARAARRAG